MKQRLFGNKNTLTLFSVGGMISMLFLLGFVFAPQASAASSQLNFTIFMHGIGRGGDSANAESEGNSEPFYRARTIAMELYSSQNTLVSSKEFIAYYDDASGSFKGATTVDNVATGSYIVKVNADRYLQKQIPGIQNIVDGQANTMEPVTLIAGDINSDNVLNIADYNILIGCYEDLTPAVNCTEQNRVYADLTDDIVVNQFDYNLFIREIGNRVGGANTQ